MLIPSSQQVEISNPHLSARDAWEVLLPIVEPMLDKAYLVGLGINGPPLERSGRLKDTWANWQFSFSHIEGPERGFAATVSSDGKVDLRPLRRHGPPLKEGWIDSPAVAALIEREPLEGGMTNAYEINCSLTLHGLWTLTRLQSENDRRFTHRFHLWATTGQIQHETFIERSSWSEVLRSDQRSREGDSTWKPYELIDGYGEPWPSF
jgi:hypothetical protein